MRPCGRRPVRCSTGGIGSATDAGPYDLCQLYVAHPARSGAAAGRGPEVWVPKTEGTCREILKLRQALWTFVRHEEVEPTNNAAERAIRPGVLWRKGSFGTQSPQGSCFVEAMMTVVATLKQQHRNVLTYVTAACEAALCGSLLHPCFQPQMPYTRSCVLLPSSVPQVNAYLGRAPHFGSNGATSRDGGAGAQSRDPPGRAARYYVARSTTRLLQQTAS